MRLELQSLLDTGNFDGATQLCEERLRDEPGDADAHRYLAIVHAAQGRPGLAVRAARRACELAPADPRPWSDLGRVHIHLLDTEFIEEDDPFIGTTPAGSADWQLGLFSSYELQGGPLKGLGAGVGLFAIGDRGVGAFSATAGTLEGYERVDLSAFYNDFKPFNIQLQVRNVFDEKYVESADRAGAYATFGSPTAVLLTVRYDFE